MLLVCFPRIRTLNHQQGELEENDEGLASIKRNERHLEKFVLQRLLLREVNKIFFFILVNQRFW